MVPGRSLGCTWCEDVEIRGSENETYLGASGPPWQVVAAFATMPALVSRPQTVWFGLRVPAGLEPADGDDLVPGPDSDGEGVGAESHDSLS
jgi:hypothetical protein